MGASPQKKYFIVDGNSFVFRAFFALPQFTTSSGVVVNAIFGVTKMLLQLMKKNKPDLLCVAFDHKGKSFRHEAFAEYKAHREETPDALKGQFEPIKEVVRLLGLPLVEIEGVEADDSIATFVTLHRTEPNTAIHIITGDKDMMQLVGDNVFIYDTMKEVVYDREKVKEKMGVYPEQIADLLGLMGDSSDNIPGVPGVGPKTAQKLLEEYGSLDNILERKENITGSVGEKIRGNIDSARMSKELATVKSDVDLSHLVFQHTEVDTKGLEDFFNTYEFRSLLKELHELFGSASGTEEKKHVSIEKDWKYIHSKDALSRLEKSLLAFGSAAVAAKYEQSKEQQDLTSIAISMGLKETYVCTPSAELTFEDIHALLFTLADRKGFLLSGHNLKQLFHDLDTAVAGKQTSENQLSLFTTL